MRPACIRQSVAAASRGSRLAFGIVAMAKSIHVPKSYGFALILSLMLQVSSWLICFVAGSMYGPAEVSGGMVLNWRVWTLSCSAFWLGFLLVFVTRRESPSLWRLLYTGLAFPILFITAAYLVANIYGER